VLVNSYFLFLILKYNKYANDLTRILDNTNLRRLYRAEYVTKSESRVLLHLCIPARQVRLFFYFSDYKIFRFLLIPFLLQGLILYYGDLLAAFQEKQLSRGADIPCLYQDCRWHSPEPPCHGRQ